MPPPPPRRPQTSSLIRSPVLQLSAALNTSTAASAAKSSAPPAPVPEPDPNASSVLLTSFLNDSAELSFEHALKMGGAGGADSDSSNEFVPQEQVVQARLHAIEMAGARVAHVLLRAFTRHLHRCFLKWKFNHKHVRASLVCGGEILGKLDK